MPFGLMRSTLLAALLLLLAVCPAGAGQPASPRSARSRRGRAAKRAPAETTAAPAKLEDASSRMQHGAMVCVEHGDCPARLRGLGYATAELAAQQAAARTTAAEQGFVCSSGLEPCFAVSPSKVVLGTLESMITV
mmetsp:Transcript_7741/g.17750  ORF Transcript_7741/g.17750 Transcript_7741/m.17750 type:complete len:135 (+) Transcript_7741:107-511(+)